MILKKVLIIDDDDLSIFLMGLTIDDIDFIKAYDSVNSGWEALKYLEKTDTDAPEVIFRRWMDMNLSNVTRRILQISIRRQRSL
jgi:hypothetical protein